MKNESEIILAILVIAGAFYYLSTKSESSSKSGSGGVSGGGGLDISCPQDHIYDISTATCKLDCPAGTVEVAHPVSGDHACFELNSDINADGVVSTEDILNFLSVFGTETGQYTNNLISDFNQDGWITTGDLLVILGSFGQEVRKGINGGLTLTGGFINAV